MEENLELSKGKMIPVESVIRHVNDNADSLEIGTPSKGGVIKVYCDFNNPEAAKVKIDNAVTLRDYLVSKTTTAAGLI